MDPEPNLLLNLPWGVILNTLVVFFLLICSALISGAEVAFFSLTTAELNLCKESKDKRLNGIEELMNDPKKALATILVTNNFVNILIVLLFASLGNYYFESITTVFDLYIVKLSLRFLLEVVLITFLILLFGEVIPKLYASRNAMRFSRFMAPILRVLEKVSYFITQPMMSMSGVIENRLGTTQNDLSVEKLSQALELTSDGATTENEQKILEGIVSFGNTETVEVMKPRIDIIAINENTEYHEVIDSLVKHGYSRNPVYRDSIDQIVGVLYAKDLLPHLNKKNFKWQRLIREPYFVPENKKLDDLLVDFQEMKNHLAIVVDEYGGTSGLVTLEDVIEEIVGDISDEFDEVDLIYSKLDEFNYVFEGKTTLKDFYKIVELDQELFEESRGEAETLAGFLLEIYGRFPKVKDKITFDSYSFQIEAMSRNRITQLKFTLPNEK
ncbi:gliding motility-associated protein GldE [Flavobacteriaceae bacterium]|nr:gliding motility-associated protein GldE [Flavobacteriaceae bacterium]